MNAFELKEESFCVMGLGKDMREYIDTAVVPGTSERSLLDTGATFDAINAQLLAEYGLSDKIDSNQSGRASLADGTSVKVEGHVQIPVEVNNNKYKVNFRVVDKLQPKIIYGVPFLTETGVLKKFRDSVKEQFANMSKN